jgi:hypothetical protein
MDDDRDLHGVLGAWRVDTALPPGFQDHVWRRIARQETRAAASVWERMAASIIRALARPRVAVSYVAVLVLAGLLAGYWQARAETERETQALGNRYVQMLDPYQMPQH